LKSLVCLYVSLAHQSVPFGYLKIWWATQTLSFCWKTFWT
jgi:hypothetical protein